MKPIYFFLLLILIGCGQTQETPTIYGRWKTSFKNGSKVLVVFRQDGTHDYFIDEKLFSTGKFSFRSDTLRESDPICSAAYVAEYKVSFVAPDSMRFAMIQDTCAPRAADLNGLALKRVNQ
nr:hypothetical protein [uncultured Arsenicibacter sp.]